MRKILFIYPSMILGGSTTSLLSIMNGLNSEKYRIDLQLQQNSGPLFEDIPSHVNILPAAQRYSGRKGKIFRILRFVLQGGASKSFFTNRKYRKKGFSEDVINAFWAKSLSKTNEIEYDYAISFLEGWSSWYLAYNVRATKKYAWQHSTFSKITSTPNEQLSWMRRVDKIIFVDDSCTAEFKKILPCMDDKAITIKNITDSEIIRKKSNRFDEADKAYHIYKVADCFKIITVCRIMIETKGLDRIVKCAKKLKESGLEFLWYIVGNGPDEKKLYEMIAEADVYNYLVPVGVRFNPHPLMKEADIMCMPSRYEGKPMVITESMILGVPPVVTEYLSAHQQIQNGIIGIVVNNDDESITSAVHECLENKEMLSNLKKQLYLQEHGNKEYIKEIEHILFE